MPTWASRYVAWMAKHMGDSAASVVGAARVGRADLPGVRVVPILGAQGGYPQSAVDQIQYLIDVWGMLAAEAVLLGAGLAAALAMEALAVLLRRRAVAAPTPA